MRHDLLLRADTPSCHLPHADPFGLVSGGPVEAAIRIEVAHRTPIRTRLRCPALRGDEARLAGLAVLLAFVPGVTSADANPVTGSITVHHEPDLAPAAIESGLAPYARVSPEALADVAVDAVHSGRHLALCAARAIEKRTKIDPVEFALEILASLIRGRPSRRLVECLALVLAARVVETAYRPARTVTT